MVSRFFRTEPCLVGRVKAFMRTRPRLAPCLAGFLIACAVGLRASPPPQHAGSPAPPRPIPQTNRFENDVLVDLTQDRDRDGRPDLWQSFRGGDLVRLELDRDRDGKADWRETWEPDPKRPPELKTELIEGRWRIVPFNVVKSIHGHAPSPGFYTGKAEKHVEGRWIDTFDDNQLLTYGGADENNLKVVRRTAHWRFEGGKPVEAIVTGDGHFSHATWKEGRPLAWEDGVAEDKLRCVEQYRDGERLSRTFYDEAGKPTSRVTGDPAWPRWEVFRDGKWTGDYEDVVKDAQDRVSSRKVYRDGRRSLDEMFEQNAGGALVRRTRYEADRGRVEEQADSAGNVYLRSQYAPDGTPRRIEKLVDGRWVGDFEEDASGTRLVYRDGRLIRLERGGNIDDNAARVAVFHDDGREEWGDGKTTRYWYTYSHKPGQVRRRVREARDLDGDGKADLKVDYERLTVEQPMAPE